MDEITVGVLTVSDRCASGEAVDESGPLLVELIRKGAIANGTVATTSLVPDSREDIEHVLRTWCDEDISLVLTTGGTGLSDRDVTPEATAAVLDRTVPGIPLLLFQRSSAATPLAALSRGTAGVRGRTLIVNFPGSRKAAKECLEALSGVIPHAVDVLRGRKGHVERVHAGLRKKSSVRTDCPELRSRSSPYKMVSVEEAQRVMVEKLGLIQQEEVVSYREALGHVLKQEVLAPDDLPPFDVSLVDGYATGDSSEVLRLMGSCKIGECPPDIKLEGSTCVSVSTGGPVPPGTVRVVPIENTSLNSEGSKTLRVVTTASSMVSNIRLKGSDYQAGQKLVDQGTYVCPVVAGILAAAGASWVKVFRKPRVAVLSTGNEVVEAGEAVKPGKIRDCNRMVVLSLLRRESFEAVDLGICRDEPDALRDALEEGFRAADVVVTTGSMSMGERDYLKRVFVEDFGGEICFGRVCMKPGKPTALGVVSFESRAKLWFGFPGNPASAVVASHLFLLPALRMISSRKKAFPEKISVEAKSPPADPDRPQYISTVAKFSLSEKSFTVGKLSSQRSSWIGSFVDTNCLVEVPVGSASKLTAFLIGEPVFVD